MKPRAEMLERRDVDGKPFWIGGFSLSDILDLEARLRRDAKAAKCNMRDVPTLGAPARRNWPAYFRVTQEDGFVTRIERGAS